MGFRRSPFPLMGYTHEMAGDHLLKKLFINKQFDQIVRLVS